MEGVVVQWRVAGFFFTDLQKDKLSVPSRIAHEYSIICVVNWQPYLHEPLHMNLRNTA